MLMTGLDQAPAATETSDQPTAGEQRPGSKDSQARYPNGVSAADQDPGYYDGDVQAALAADTTPTRQQVARDTGTDHQDGDRTAGTSRDAATSSRDPDIDAILHENDRLPEPRTRQEAAREKADGQTVEVSPAESPSSASGHAPDIEAILHENDHLPEPRTRQEATRDIGGNQNERRGPDPLADAATTGRGNNTVDRPATVDHGVGEQPPDSAPLGQADHDQPFTVVHASPEMRTFGDDTPTGIGLKPTGDQVVEMENDKASRAERARREFLSGERLGDAFDATDEWAQTGQDLFRRPPTGQHIEVPTHGPAFTAMPQQEIDPGSVATAALALGIVGAECVRWGKRRLGDKRGRDHAGVR